VTTGHGKVAVKSRDISLGVGIRDGVEGVGGVKDVVVEGESAGGDKVDTLALDELVGSKTLLLGDLEELLGRRFLAPVRLESLLDLTVGTDTGEAENSAVTVSRNKVSVKNSSHDIQPARTKSAGVRCGSKTYTIVNVLRFW